MERAISSRLIYMGAILDALRETGGAASSKDIYEILVQIGIARTSDIRTVQTSGESRFVKEVRFARKELVDAGLVVNGAAGVWSLSLDGWRTCLTPEGARELVRLRRHGGAKRMLGSHKPAQVSGSVPTSGPPPSDWSKTVSRRSDRSAWTYIMRYGTTDVWKIGFATDVEARLGEINQHIPVEVTNCHWMHYARHPWPDSHSAFAMEQRLLKTLETVRTRRERVRCTETEILDAWRDAARHTRLSRPTA